MPRQRHHHSSQFKPSIENSSNAQGAAANNPISLPQTAEECAREIVLLEGHQRAIMERRKVLTAQLQNVLDKQKPRGNLVDLEHSEFKANNAEKRYQTSEAGNGSWEELEEGAHNQSVFSSNLFVPNDADDGDMSGEVASPLISAIRKLQLRHDQKRGIKMWTKYLANLFGVTDKDGSGYIDQQEYQRMLNMLNISKELKFDLRDKFSHIDKDGNGINLKEFLVFFMNSPIFQEELEINAKSNAPYIYETNLSGCQYLRMWLYCVVECPDYNLVSKILFCLDLIMTIVPIIIFCVEGAQSSLIITWPRQTFMWFVSIFFLLEYTCGFALCRYKSKFIFDIGHIFELVSFVFWIYFNTLGESDTLDPMGFVVFRVFRYLDLYKIFKLSALEEDLHIYVNTLKLAYTSSGAVLMLLVLTIFFFSLLMYVFERGMWNPYDKRWQRDEQEGESPFADLSGCIYFVIVTMTTLGYGDLLPKSQVGRMVAMITVFVGLCNITFLINIVGDCFEEVFRKFVLKKSMEMERERSFYLKRCVQGAQVGTSNWLHLGKTSSRRLRNLKVTATANANELI